MALYIKSKNGKEYCYSYGMLHNIRALTLLCYYGIPERFCGSSICDWYNFNNICHGGMGSQIFDKISPDDNMEFLDFTFALISAGHDFPNLLLHSDCDGRYTKDGKISDKLMTGNSVQLLEELYKLINNKKVKKYKETIVLKTLNDLYEAVKDQVENGNGVIKFE